VFRAGDFGVQLPEAGTWRVFDHEDWQAGIRRDGGLCYMVAMRGTKAEMQTLLDSLKK
jgi:hypothetical protein